MIFREIITNRIQNIRKDKDFNVTDRISVRIENHPLVAAAVAGFGEYIKAEVLADELVLASNGKGEQVELAEDLTLTIEVKLS